MDLDGLKDAIVSMLGGMRCKINTRTFQNDMLNINGKDDVLTLLIHLGYLAYDSEKKEIHIPNQEVADEFRRCCGGGIHGLYAAGRDQLQQTDEET